MLCHKHTHVLMLLGELLGFANTRGPSTGTIVNPFRDGAGERHPAQNTAVSLGERSAAK